VSYSFSEGISTGRVVRYVWDLRTWSSYLGKDFEDANKDDIVCLVGKLERSGRFKKSTMRDLKLTLRKFFKWMRNTEGFPEEVAWYKTHVRYDGIKNPEDMLTEEEVQKMICARSMPRDRAFIAALYESGCRIGEILPLKLSQLRFDANGAQLLVNGKTGFRRVRVIASVPYLTEWVNKHPRKDDPESPLWLSEKAGKFSYGAAVQLLKRTAKLGGISKRVNPHNFRHSRASFIANHLTEAQMNEYFGWAQGSDMTSIYVHLSGRDVDGALLRLNGIETAAKKQESIMTPKKCPRCQEANQATNKFCSRCGIALDSEAKMEIVRQTLDRKEADAVLDRLLEDGEFREMFVRKLQMANLSKPRTF
jgi:site-specific recombinase XerD